ncbi:hypothetical protein [Sideroxyarcus sp. TK5]
MPSHQSQTSGRKLQHGGALLVMLVILVMGITTVFITSLSSTAIQNRRNHSSAESLARAKEALIGYALTYGDTHTAAHGYLPCPDLSGSNGEGSSPGSCGSSGVHQLGRLPWRTLDLPALFDGSGECLWYAVSGKYKNNPASSTTMNWDNTGDLTIYADNGNTIEANEVVAAIIAPGKPLSGNSDRAGSSAPTCGGNYTAAAYLENDTAHGVNNADGTQGKFILPHEHRDSNGNVTLETNDQILFITRQDLWNAIQKRIARQAKKCLDDYAADASNPDHKYPWAVQLSDTTASPNRTGTLDVRFGRFPDSPNTGTAGGGSCPASGSNLTTLSSAQISTLNSYINQVSTALTNYKNSPSSTTRNNLQDAGDNLWDLVKDSPYNLPVGDAIRSSLGYYIKDQCSDPCYSSIPTFEDRLADAISEFNGCTGSGGTDSSMPSSWTSISSCNDLVTSASWPAWRDLLFIQIADGYQPGAAGSCTTGSTCLSISGTGHTNAGSGSYHAVVVAASKSMSGQDRSVTSTLSNFLEGANKTGKTSPPTTTTFETYRPTDTSYSTVNDLALCIDGKNNCP